MKITFTNSRNSEEEEFSIEILPFCLITILGGRFFRIDLSKDESVSIKDKWKVTTSITEKNGNFHKTERDGRGWIFDCHHITKQGLKNRAWRGDVRWGFKA